VVRQQARHCARYARGEAAPPPAARCVVQAPRLAPAPATT